MHQEPRQASESLWLSQNCHSLTLYCLILAPCRFVPEATPAHLRYFQLMLDANGDSAVTYKELASAFKAANRSELRLAWLISAWQLLLVWA